MKQDVEEIKRRIDIVELVNEYVQLTPAGSNFKALSPFRSERTPSFMVSPDLQIFKDFGGDKAGDIFTFLMEVEGVTFREALEVLAERAGVPLQRGENASSSTAQSEAKKKLFEVLQDSAKFYQAVLHHEKYGQTAREYISTRGLTDETLHDFGVGFAPQSFSSLTNSLIKRSYSTQEQVESGMVIQSQKNNKLYDRFRGRVMIPIRDPLGRTVGFTGRVLPEFDDGKMGKYVNSPQTSLFDKKRLLFGLDLAKIHIKQQKRVILVEGQMDVMMSHQVGVNEVVAVSGTALTDEHIRLIKRYTNQYCLCFDNDSAGLEACKRSAKKILEHGGVVSVIPLRSGKDAADIIAENPEEWKDISSKPIEFIEYYIQDVVAQATDIESRQKVAKEAVEIIKNVTDPIQKNAHVQKISTLLGLLDQDMYRLLEESRTTKKPYGSRYDQSTQNSPTVTKVTPSVRLQRTIIGYMLFNLENYDILEQEEYIFTQPVLRSIFHHIKTYYTEHSTLSREGIFTLLNADERTLFEEVYFEAERAIQENTLSQEQIHSTLQDAIELLRVQYKRAVVRALRRQLKQVKQSGDRDQVHLILQKISKLTESTN